MQHYTLVKHTKLLSHPHVLLKKNCNHLQIIKIYSVSVLLAEKSIITNLFFRTTYCKQI